MDNELYLLSLNLRAVAHCMHFASGIADITKDSDFISSIMSVFSDYLYAVSDITLEKLSSNFTDTGFDRRAVFGRNFSEEFHSNFKDESD